MPSIDVNRSIPPYQSQTADQRDINPYSLHTITLKLPLVTYCTDLTLPLHTLKHIPMHHPHTLPHFPL